MIPPLPFGKGRGPACSAIELIDDVHIGEALPLSSFGGEGWGEEALYPCRPHRRTDCTQIMRKLENQRYLPPPGDKLGKKPVRKPPWENKYTHGRGM
jgi:hypothetical protein